MSGLPMTHADYLRYLRSTHYRTKVRAPALERAGGKCERCGRVGRLQIHHRDYFRVGTSEEVHDVEALCGACHKRAGRH